MPRKSNTRAASGGGSIRQRPDGRWEARVTVGTNPGTGKPIRCSIYGSTQAELETEVKLRDANTYTDQKLLEVYKYFDNKIGGVEAQLCQQAVYNATNTAALNCMQGQIAQLQSLTKMVIPNSSVCPGWGAATVTVSTGTTTTT